MNNSGETTYYMNNGLCPKCGKPYIYIGDVPWSGWTPGQEPYCTCREKELEKPSYVSFGWQCPNCNRIFAPYVSECAYCNKGNFNYTITTDTNFQEEEDE